MNENTLEERKAQIEEILSVASLGGLPADEKTLQAALAYEQGSMSLEEFRKIAQRQADR